MMSTLPLSSTTPGTPRFGAKGGNQNHRLSHPPRNPQEEKKVAKVQGQANAQKDRKGGDVRFGESFNRLA